MHGMVFAMALAEEPALTSERAKNPSGTRAHGQVEPFR